MSSERRDIAAEISYVMECGSSPEAEAARVLQRFMCCKAGEDLVEHGLLRPFGYSLEPGHVVAENRRLQDAIDRAYGALIDDARALSYVLAVLAPVVTRASGEQPG